MSREIALKKRRHESFGDRMVSVVCYIVFGICALLCLYPFYYMFINTISANDYPLQFVLYQYLNQASSLSALANTSSSSSLAAAAATTQTATSIRMTITIIVVLPIMCVYPFFQKYFVKGIMVGAVKG